MAEDLSFPRVMRKGRFKGQRFETSKDYANALNGSKQQRPSAREEWRFHLRMTAGSLEIEVAGDPRKPEDVDKLLELLGKFGKAA